MVEKISVVPDGVVLAGGAGRRMGGGKASVELDGEALVCRAVDILNQVCRRVVVAGRPEVALPPDLRAEVVYDQAGWAGPVAGIAVGLAALTADDVLVLACDLPMAGPAIQRLAEARAGCAIMCVSEDGPQPLCARLPRERGLEVARRLLAESVPAARALLRELAAEELTCPAEWLTNLNSPEDVQRVDILLDQQSQAAR